MPTLEERLTTVEANLAEAATELSGLPAELAALRAELVANGFTPLADEKLTSAETIAETLKNLVETPGAKPKG